MNKLNEDIQLIIYKYKHQLEYKSVTDELLQAKLNVFSILAWVTFNSYIS